MFYASFSDIFWFCSRTVLEVYFRLNVFNFQNYTKLDDYLSLNKIPNSGAIEIKIVFVSYLTL